MPCIYRHFDAKISLFLATKVFPISSASARILSDMYYEDVFIALNKANVRYLVAGGLAVNLHGIPRMTADLDIIVSFDEENIKKLAQALDKAGYKPKVPVKVVELADSKKRAAWQKGMHVFSLFHYDNSYELIDIFIDHPIDFEQMYERKNIAEHESVKIPIVSRKDLIALKTIAARKQDLDDIEHLRRIDKIGPQ